MRHVKRYAKLGRDSAHRRSMLRNLTTQFFIHGYIKTTVSRAKAVQPIIERCITRAIKSHHGDLGAYRSFTQYLHPTTHTLKVYRYFADHTTGHQGGRTSLKKLGIYRMGDGAPMALLHLNISSTAAAKPPHQAEPHQHSDTNISDASTAAEDSTTSTPPPSTATPSKEAAVEVEHVKHVESVESIENVENTEAEVGNAEDDGVATANTADTANAVSPPAAVASDADTAAASAQATQKNASSP